jgi:hypothetical protein
MHVFLDAFPFHRIISDKKVFKFLMGRLIKSHHHPDHPRLMPNQRWHYSTSNTFIDIHAISGSDNVHQSSVGERKQNLEI